MTRPRVKSFPSQDPIKTERDGGDLGNMHVLPHIIGGLLFSLLVHHLCVRLPSKIDLQEAWMNIYHSFGSNLFLQKSVFNDCTLEESKNGESA